MDIIQQLTTQFKLQRWQVENTVKLLDEGNTVPFIARYRKEAHGTLDDQVIRELPRGWNTSEILKRDVKRSGISLPLRRS